MSRRRFHVVSSSDEEEDQPPPPPPQHLDDDEDIDDIISNGFEANFQTVTLNSANPTTTSTRRYVNIEPIPIDISDDEHENVNISGRTNNYSSGFADGNNSNFEVSQSPIHGELEKLGLRVRREWLDSCLQGLQSSVQGFQRMDDLAKAKLCFAQFLWADMNYCGAGVLPPNVHALHMIDLKGPFVLQVDEIVNISKPLRERYKNAAPAGSKRCLKLSMTDGAQRVFGMEYRPIKNLEVSPAGLKVVVCNVNVRHGLMLLVPENIEVLGGSVDVLEAARQRLVNELNKPPRGKRTRTGVVPPLATRGTNAAWPPSNDAVRPPSDDAVRPPSDDVVRPPSNDIVRPPSNGASRPLSNEAARPPSNEAARPPSTYVAPGIVDRTTPVNTTPQQSSEQGSPWPRAREEVPTYTDLPTVAEFQGIPLPQEQPELSWCTDSPTVVKRQGRYSMSGSNSGPISFSSVQSLESATIPQHTDEPTIEVMSSRVHNQQVTSPGFRIPEGDVNVADNGYNSVSNMSSMDVEEIIHRDNETPFTYLASLSAKFSMNDCEISVVQGKIKCFVTGVKGFQFKERSSYDLKVYVDDGSLIAAILIDHNVVQNRIGYSPQEVTSALASPDNKCVNEMKEIMIKFQTFLANFEGRMVIEMRRDSDVPVAVEMEQGCPASETLLLYNRVKNSFTSQN